MQHVAHQLHTLRHDAHVSTDTYREALRGHLLLPVTEKMDASALTLTSMEDPQAGIFSCRHMPTERVWNGVARAVDQPGACSYQYLLVPSDSGAFHCAMELSLATLMGADVILGVQDPTPDEAATQQRTEDRTGFWQHITDWIYRSQDFERSGKLYRTMGIRWFQKMVRTIIGGPLIRAAAWLLSLGEPGRTLREIEAEFRERLSRSDGGGQYTIGRIRTLERLRIFERGTRLNETSHGLATIGFLPVVGWLAASGLWVPGIYIPYLLNLYATCLQRYHRARVLNTIDLKLDRGVFAPEQLQQRMASMSKTV